MLIGLPEFDYLACDTLEQAFDLISRYAGISKILAGGTDLFVKMKHRRLMPQYLIDIKKIPELKGIHYDEQRGLRLGALTSVEEIKNSTLIRKHVSLLWSGPFLVVSLLLALCAMGSADSQAPPGESNSSKSASDASQNDRPEYRLLENRLTLREPFNKAKDKVRIVSFLSPSCQRCLKNAGQLQREFLAKNPEADLAVFVVWLKVLQNDEEFTLDEAMQKISDARVQHFWDPERVLNAQLLDAVMFDVQVRLYDIFMLYDGSVQWEKRLPRPGYWMHEYKGAPGPWWDIGAFAKEIDKGLQGEPFSSPIN